jgi:MazG family protein
MSTPPSTDPKEARIRSTEGALNRILTLARVLREPGGCPWDRDQTVETLTPYLQEETYEVVEAVGGRDRDSYREEMGDLLFMVSFLGLVGEETSWGTLDEIADEVVDKLVRRHPQVFGGGKPLEADDALQQWEELKRAERGEEDLSSTPSTLGQRPAGLPALTTAFRISEKAGAVGFEWKEMAGALEKVEEEIRELRHEIEIEADSRTLEDELGDVLYSVVNLARYLRIDPERALRGTIAKFTRRVQYIAERLHEKGMTPEVAPLEGMDTRWNEAQKIGVGGNGS